MLKLGNLTVREFAEAVNADFTDEELEFLERHRSDETRLESADQFHIYKDPCISIHIGAEAASGAVLQTFVAANARRTFSQEVSFHAEKALPSRSNPDP
ncbi:hypothetical protein [Nesterenkonia pannonica]|uniref:hypothetical protein n=1 Tax=Nesterenkonia pannonica TaxID=1548602 RepID=UPI0021646B36|nr:hypothetical protein [Nesterenkonia pannonica]